MKVPVLLAVLAAALAAPAPATAAEPLVPRELASLSAHDHALVQLRADAPAPVATRLRAAGGEEVSAPLHIWRLRNTAAARLIPGLAVDGVLREFQPDRPRVLADHIAKGDPLLGEQWWLQRVGADRVEPPGPGKPITVIDSGLDVTHPEFAGRPNTTALNPQTTTGGRSEHHGTMVASLIGAPSNGIGIVGVYPQAVLYSWDASPDGRLRPSEVIRGIETAMATGPGIINLSLGGDDFDPMERDAVTAAFARGVVVVAAVGNERGRGSPAVFPASLPHVLTVASTGPDDVASPFSSLSPAIDLAAPGDPITAAVPTSLRSEGFASGQSGTSFAAPIVAAAAAWVWTARPTLEKTQLVELLRRATRDVGAPGRDADTGFGLLDIPTALTAPTPAIDPQEPNDDVEQVTAGQLFAVSKPPLTNATRFRATVSARLDKYEDQADLYRVFVPAGRKLTAALRSSGDVDLQVWSAATRTVLEEGAARRAHLLAQSARVNLGNETTVLTNKARSGVFVYVTAFLRDDAAALDASYTLNLTNAKVPVRKPRARR
jgi:hypothetical protein